MMFLRSLRPALLSWAAATLLPAAAIAKCPNGWDATAGVPGTNGVVFTTALWDPDGPGPQTSKVVVGGSFTSAGGIAANRVAMWDPATGVWSALGSGMDNFVLCFATMPNGDLVAGGGFATAGGVTANSIARWNGTAWAPFGGTAQAINGYVYALAVRPGGELIAGGTFYFAGFTLVNFIAGWNGATWSPLGTGMNNDVRSLAVLPGGDLIAGGLFTNASGVPASRLARWNGTTWSSLGAGVDGNVFALAPLPSGDLVVGGGFQNAGGAPASRIARWSPGSGLWSPLGAGTGLDVNALTVLPGGDVVAGGVFFVALGGPANYVARWNGSFWSAIGIGTDTHVRALTALPGGGFVAGGNFVAAGGAPASFFARACGNANWTAIGTGCAISGPVPALTLVSTPQLGGTFALAVAGLGGGLPVMVTGVSPANVSLWPLGLGFGPGCYLLAAPDLLQALTVVGGNSSWSLPIPNVPALAGVHLWNQVVELGAQSSASNAGDAEIR